VSVPVEDVKNVKDNRLSASSPILQLFEAGAPILLERNNLPVDDEVALTQILQRKNDVREL
jgi:hypothetical protein